MKKTISRVVIYTLFALLLVNCSSEMTVQFSMNGKSFSNSLEQPDEKDTTAYLAINIGDVVIFRDLTNVDGSTVERTWDFDGNDISDEKFKNKVNFSTSFEEAKMHKVTLCVDGSEKCFSSWIFVKEDEEYGSSYDDDLNPEVKFVRPNQSENQSATRSYDIEIETKNLFLEDSIVLLVRNEVVSFNLDVDNQLIIESVDLKQGENEIKVIAFVDGEEFSDQIFIEYGFRQENSNVDGAPPISSVSKKEDSKKKELERKRELEKKKEIERKRELEKKKQLALEEKAKKKEIALRKELEKEKDAAKRKEKEKQLAIAKQKEIDRKKELAKQKEIARKKELAKQKEIAKKKELAKQKEIAREKEAARLKEIARKKELARQKDLANKNEQTKLKDAARQKELAKKKEAERLKEIARQKEIQKKKELAAKAKKEAFSLDNFNPSKSGKGAFDNAKYQLSCTNNGKGLSTYSFTITPTANIELESFYVHNSVCGKLVITLKSSKGVQNMTTSLTGTKTQVNLGEIESVLQKGIKYEFTLKTSAGNGYANCGNRTTPLLLNAGESCDFPVRKRSHFAQNFNQKKIIYDLIYNYE